MTVQDYFRTFFELLSVNFKITSRITSRQLNSTQLGTTRLKSCFTFSYITYIFLYFLTFSNIF